MNYIQEHDKLNGKETGYSSMPTRGMGSRTCSRCPLQAKVLVKSTTMSTRGRHPAPRVFQGTRQPLRPKDVTAHPLESHRPGAACPQGSPSIAAFFHERRRSFWLDGRRPRVGVFWVIWWADGSLSSEKRCRATDIPDRRWLSFKVVYKRTFKKFNRPKMSIYWLWHGQQEVDQRGFKSRWL